MKVGHVCTSALMHKLLVDKLALMQDKGYDIHLISSKEGYNEKLVAGYSMEFRFIPMNRSIHPIQDVVSIFRLMRLIMKEKYDIIHTHNAKAGVIGRIAAWLCRTPLIIHTTHGLPFYQGQRGLTYHMYRWMEKVGSWFCHGIASQNREDMDKIKEYAPRKLVLYEGNGVDLERLDAHKAAASVEVIQALKQQYHIPMNHKVILVGARFEPVKNHFFLLDALKLLKEQSDIPFTCVLAGQGPLEQEVVQRIAELGLKEQVVLVGYQTNIYPYIEMADVVSLTSEKEGIPRIVMESMAFSKPVVASDVLGTRELVQSEVSGVLVPYLDVHALAAAYHRVLSDEGLRSSLGEQGRSIIEEQFTEQIVSHRIHEYYRELRKKDMPKKKQIKLPMSKQRGVHKDEASRLQQ
ncbi:glycosyltransferase family 4 protein [Paenibacillus aquistagni]|uniref:glycosyltransferase family 4 protein n=1 Tax=Paenibacillus aquistagni TaxID=1852522 RepID=UPI00145A6086|nr:glycosyltransferase family 4 protein [Paenibacillus aquistagni]NMM53571.1 glycosyltransferase family 4 protein [Paenibacillus aquistagni]